MSPRGWILVLLACLWPTLAAAQQPDGVWTRVEVVVTAVSGQDVYLDQGRDAGIEPGDEVRLRLLGGATRLATVRSVASTSARAELRPGEPVDVGAQGEVLVPSERLRADQERQDEAQPEPTPAAKPVAPAPGEAPQSGDAPAAPTVAPEHPPWAAGDVRSDPSAPLLAPITARTPQEREWRARGRLRTSLDWTRDDAGLSYLNARSGVDLDVENPFGKGGVLELGTEVYHRRVDVDEGEDDSETQLVVDRLSYTLGGRRGAPNRLEVGRFLQHEFPEFGLIDGVEAIHRADGGDRLGFSAGFLPEPNDRLSSGDDLGVALFYSHVSDPEETLSAGLGYQKTWHEGHADRDLLVGKVGWIPSPRTRLFASAWVDLYTSDDTVKGAGLELTQLLLNANVNWDSVGVGLFATQIRFPELLRNEFNTVTAEQLADERIQRVGLSSWVRQSRRVRWDGRVNAWSDEDDSGGGGDLRVTARDLLWQRGSASLGVYSNTGDFTSGDGLRASATRDFDAGSLRLDYDLTRFDQSGGATTESITQQAASLSYDTTLGSGWDVSLYLQQILRDGDDSLTLGITLQKRF